MQRSESILVWAVSAIVVVIVGVAIVFGRNDELGNGRKGDGLTNGETGLSLSGGGVSDAPVSNRNRDGAASPGGGNSAIANLLDSMRDQNLDPKTGTNPAANGAGAVDPNVIVEMGPMPPGGLIAQDAAAARSLRAALGEFRLEGQPDGSRYRVVTARARDTFSGLVQDWAGSLSHLAEVRALNEGLDPEKLRVGDEVWFPWIDDAVLIDAHESRRVGVANENRPAGDGRASTDLGEPRTPAVSTPNVSPLAAPSVAKPPDSGEWRTVKPGESLWRIASEAVGQRKAEEFIAQILRLNPSISDPSRVQAGDRVLMPKR